MVVAGAASTTDPQNPTTTASRGGEPAARQPLLPSEKDNSNGISNNPKKPKSRIVSSRYMSPSTPTPTSNSSSSKRYPSPLASRNSTPTPSLGPKRSTSVDRRRPAASKPDHDVSAATKLLVKSTKSLSVSFQGEAFSLPISKTKVALAPSSPNTSSLRKTIKPIDQHLTARNRFVNPLLKSLDSLNGSLKNSIDGRLSLDLGHSNGNSLHGKVLMACDLTASDSDSVSSSSTSDILECSRTYQRQNGSSENFVSPRFWQETNTRLRRLQELGSPLSKLKQYTDNGSIVSSRRTMSSPIKAISPSRGNSPFRIRNAVSTINNSFIETPSVLSFAVDVRRGKVGVNKILDAHLLRLLYNHHLQWRFINARTEALLLLQKYNAEKNLWNARIMISYLRDNVTKRRTRLQLLREKLKLASILGEQLAFLEDWESMEKDHSASLVGAIEALKASTIRLSVVGGATVELESLRGAMCSSLETMQAMASSIHLLAPKVEEVNYLMKELVKLAEKERGLVEQCTYFISLLAAMQVKQSSLRTHIVQCNRIRTV